MKSPRGILGGLVLNDESAPELLLFLDPQPGIRMGPN